MNLALIAVFVAATLTTLVCIAWAILADGWQTPRWGEIDFAPLSDDLPRRGLSGVAPVETPSALHRGNS